MVLPLKQIQEQEAPILTLPNAYDYYYDRYSEQNEGLFITEKATWHNIKQNNSSNKPLTDKEVEYIGLINGFLKNSPEAVAYLSKDYLCQRLNICDRQLRRIRKNTSHIFKTKWRKKTKTYRGILNNVYAIRPTEHTVFLLKETKYYKSVKVGHQCPISIYKYEKNIIKNRSSTQARESNFSENSESKIIENITTPEPAEIHKLPLLKKPRILNQRKKPTNSETKAKVIRFNQYKEPQDLAYHYPLNQEDCTKLQNKSGRSFTLNVMNEILLDMSKRVDRVFNSKAQFIAYFGKCLIYEKRDAVQTSNDNFYIKANKKPEELIEHREQAEMNRCFNQVEQDSITNRSDENQFKARIANSFSPQTAYIFLKNLSFIRKTEEGLELHLASRCSLTLSEETRLLWQAQSIGGYADTQELKFITSGAFVYDK